jgi:hypothetical protein
MTYMEIYLHSLDKKSQYFSVKKCRGKEVLGLALENAVSVMKEFENENQAAIHSSIVWGE